MQIKMITPSDKLWNSVVEYAESCSWSAGKFLAKDMKNNFFFRLGESYCISGKRRYMWVLYCCKDRLYS